MNRKHLLYRQDINNMLDVRGIETLKGKKVLITGATGLIGTCLIDALMTLNENDYNISVIAVGRDYEKVRNHFAGYFKTPWFSIIQQDVIVPFPDSLSVDLIFPLASNTHPLYYSKYPVETILTNIKGAENALELATKCGATVIYPSTVEIYGNARGEDIFTEDYTGSLNLSNSRSCYTESKRVSESLCQSYISEKGVNVKIARLSRLFGPTVLATDTKASSQFIKKAVACEDIVLKSEGNQFFSYTYVADAVNALLYIAINGETGVPYNISNKTCNVRLRDFADCCARCSGKKVVFELPSEVERKGYSVASFAILDNSRLVSIGWTPKYALKDAIQRTITILNEYS